MRIVMHLQILRQTLLTLFVIICLSLLFEMNKTGAVFLSNSEGSLETAQCHVIFLLAVLPWVSLTLVNVYVDLLVFTNVVFTHIAGTS